MKNSKKENVSVDLSGLSDASKRAIRSNMLEDIMPDEELLDSLRQLDEGKVDKVTCKKEGIKRILSPHG